METVNAVRASIKLCLWALTFFWLWIVRPTICAFYTVSNSLVPVHGKDTGKARSIFEFWVGWRTIHTFLFNDIIDLLVRAAQALKESIIEIHWMEAFNTSLTVPKSCLRALACLILGIIYPSFLAFDALLFSRVKIGCLWTSWALFSIEYGSFCWAFVAFFIFFWINLVFRARKTHLRALVKILRGGAFNTWLIGWLVWFLGWTLACHWIFILCFSIFTSLTSFCLRVIDFFFWAFASIWIYVIFLAFRTFSARPINIQWSLLRAET